MVDPATQRWLNQIHPEIRSERLTLDAQRQRKLKSIHIERRQFQSILNIPVYLYGYITELVKVNLDTQTIACKFTLFVTIFNTLEEEHMRELMSHRENGLVEDEESLKEEYIKLLAFISNNLVIQCGQLTIDIVNDQRIEIYDSESEEEAEESDDFYYRQVTTQSKETRTYQINGTFQCDLDLDNKFFPYHTISSHFRLKVHKMYYDNIILKYNPLMFQDQITHEYAQFGFKFLEKKLMKFGIYCVNLRSSTYSFQPRTKKMELVHYDYLKHRDTYDSSKDFLEVTQCLQFNFELYSFNVPFMMRNLVPQLVMCFLSLVNYFHDTDVYGNVIMLSITLIELLSNFRRSKYDNSTLNLFQITIFGIIVINFLLLVEATRNIYNGRDDIFRVNTKDQIFWVSVGIASLLLIVNTGVQLYLRWTVEQQPSIKEAKDSTHGWMWNEEAVSHIVEELEEHSLMQNMRSTF